MNTGTHLSPDDLALFALQLLSPEEMRNALEHTQHCDICRPQVADLQGDLALIGLAAELQTPAAHMRERLLRGIAAEPRSSADPSAALQLASGADAATPANESSVATRSASVSNILQMDSRSVARRGPSRFLAASGWALAACLALAAGLLFHQRQQLQGALSSERAQLSSLQENALASQAAVSTLTDPAALNVELHQPSASSGPAHLPEGHAAYLPDRGSLVFVADNLEPLQPYKVYELWLLPVEKGAAPIAAGSFRPDASGHASIIVPAGPKLIAISGFGVTREDDKSEPKAPTLPILLAGSKI